MGKNVESRLNELSNAIEAVIKADEGARDKSELVELLLDTSKEYVEIDADVSDEFAVYALSLFRNDKVDLRSGRIREIKDFVPGRLSELNNIANKIVEFFCGLEDYRFQPCSYPTVSKSGEYCALVAELRECELGQNVVEMQKRFSSIRDNSDKIRYYLKACLYWRKGIVEEHVFIFSNEACSMEVRSLPGEDDSSDECIQTFAVKPGRFHDYVRHVAVVSDILQSLEEFNSKLGEVDRELNDLDIVVNDVPLVLESVKDYIDQLIRP